MKTAFFALTSLLFATTALGQAQVKQQQPAFGIGASYNEHKRGAARTLQYTPDGDDFVCVNGKNRFTRALYGSITPFRLETSDCPVFAAYDKRNSKNIRFVVSVGTRQIALDSVAYCEARYTAGKRSYRLTDPSWGKGQLRISVLAFPDEEGAVWQITPEQMSAGATLTALLSPIKAKRLSRNGDMGADPADSFEPLDLLQPQQSCNLSLHHNPSEAGKLPSSYLILKDLALQLPPAETGKALYDKAEKARTALASRIKIETPDPYLNTLGGALAVAADGIWDGEVWLHGAVGWRMPLSGWRAGYTGDALGWHDRARRHFDAYAASQVTTVPNTIPHPAQDSLLNLARSEKRWGTPQYSNGYICRNPHQDNQMHHYDMNLCYIDELLWHLNWTGDIAYARKMWPVITRHLAWEKMNYEPDNDGLYDAYACIWASDALYYNSGAVTHSSAYNYRANKMAALIAELIGQDATPYRTEAEAILKAMNHRLWIPSKGHWAEYQDFMGHRRLHESAGVWTIYHALDSETANPFQAYQATRYVDTSIPHIPVSGTGLVDENYATIATTNWLPYAWSINNAAFAEVMHTALSYFQAGRPEAGYKLMKSSLLDGMYLGDSPGNFGQVSFYDAARGECYRDFGDPVGVASRMLIQGLFGILPDALNGKLIIRPGFPMNWDKASLSTPDVAYRFQRIGEVDTYRIDQQFIKPLALTLHINARKERIRSIKVNGAPVQWNFVESASGYPVIAIPASTAAQALVEIVWEGEELKKVVLNQSKLSVAGTSPSTAGTNPAAAGVETTVTAVAKSSTAETTPSTVGAETVVTAPVGMTIEKLYDPQSIFTTNSVKSNQFKGRTVGNPGQHTFFLFLRQGQMEWWQPINLLIEEQASLTVPPFGRVQSTACAPVAMQQWFNASVTDIFRNEYLSPRSPYTTLQLPKQGIGEWCHPKTTAEIDDSGMRALVREGILPTSLGVPFHTPVVGANIAFTSLWDNYPDSLSIPLTGRASHAYLLMAGTTNHMQCRIANGVIRVCYKDGTSEVVELINPNNWCPIEQDFFIDGLAFNSPSARPYRLCFRSGLVSNNLERDLGITGVYGRSIAGGAGVLLDIPLDASKELSRLTLETLSNDVVIGLMGITLQR